MGKLILVLAISSLITFQKSDKNITGTYGSYMDFSWFTELVLNEDLTFQYHDQVELGTSFKYSGTWTIKGKKINLTSNDNNDLRPMPKIWTIKKSRIVSERVKRNGKTRKRIILSYKNGK
jgi:hypothetical protein